ncbi:hypothetical protein FRC02_012230 [Tulasnella sp. 418]|nr:hypothetical protein FRC02_012230 [Tulasnella sp. 418]
MCKTYHCGLNNQCQEPVGSEVKILLWQYIVTGAGIVAFILSILLGLFFIHKRDRASKQKEYREYYHEQNTYRQSIISLHTTARDRVSLYSASSSRFSQYDEHGQLVYSDDTSQRHLLGNRRASQLRESVIFDEEDESDEERAQGRKLLSGENYASSSRDTPRQSMDHGERESFDYSQPAMGGQSGGYGAVPTRESMDLPYGASAPRRGEFKDPWSK